MPSATDLSPNATSPLNRFAGDRLKVLMEALNEPFNREGYRHMAMRLSALASKDPPWQFRYVYSLVKDQLEPSPLMLRAIQRLELIADDVPEIVAASERVEVLSADGRIPPGSFVMGEARYCKGCGLSFVGSVPWRVYCPSCRPPRKRK